MMYSHVLFVAEAEHQKMQRYGNDSFLIPLRCLLACLIACFLFHLGLPLAGGQSHSMGSTMSCNVGIYQFTYVAALGVASNADHSSPAASANAMG